MLLSSLRVMFKENDKMIKQFHIKKRMYSFKAFLNLNFVTKIGLNSRKIENRRKYKYQI